MRASDGLGNVQFSVFTKPWLGKSIDALAADVAALGFDGVELPVRPGFAVNPGNMKVELPRAARVFEGNGLKIFSVAGASTDATISACGDAGIPTLRVMAPISEDRYLVAEERIRSEIDAVVPSLEKHRVRLGVQNHYGRYVCNACGLRALLAGYDPAFVGAVWDAAHNALQGEEPEFAIDILWRQLCMVNLKNAFWRLESPESVFPEWTAYWTTGRDGLASWPRVAIELERRQYAGVVCLTAEYSDAALVDRNIADDLLFARSLFASPGG